MRILICMTATTPWSQAIATTLQSIGHEVHVVGFPPGHHDGLVDVRIPGIASDFERFRPTVSGVHFLRASGNGKAKYVYAAPALAALARRLRTEILLTLYAGGFATMAYLSGIRPFAVYVVGSDVLRVGRVGRGVNRVVLAAASRVFANGIHLAEKALEQAPRARVMPLLIGVDVDALPIADPREGPPQLICTRGFEPVYDNARIIEALAHLPDDCPDHKVVFTSGGALLEETKSLADRLLSPKARARVEFWGGVTHERLERGLRESQFFLSMSRSDGTSTALLEALASGLHPIISDITQNREWLPSSGPNGTLVALDDVDRLSAAILHAIASGGPTREVAAENRSLVRDRASSVMNRKRLAESLEDAVREHRASLPLRLVSTAMARVFGGLARETPS